MRDGGDGRRRVVITGMGAVTPVGLDVESAWAAVVAGRSGIRRITHFDVDGDEWRVKIAGEAHGFDPLSAMTRKEARRADRNVQLAVAAAQQAVDQARLPGGDDIGVIVGSGSGGIETYAANQRVMDLRGPGRMEPLLIPMEVVDSAAVQVSIRFGAHGPNVGVASACATGADAIGLAFETIRRGDAEAMIAGGTEAAVTPLGIAGFDNLGALSRRNGDPAGASRPFDGERAGFVLGEGAGVVVLESLAQAVARGARPLAEVLAYATTADAAHLTAPGPEARQAARAVGRALEKAGLGHDEVGYINAHATGTPVGDPLEVRAYRAVFGERIPPVSSTKSVTGHLLGAAGAVEAIFCVLAIRDGVLPPTINQCLADPRCALDSVPNSARRANVRVALSSAFGFGGHNVILAIAAPPE
ncbi:MAG: beta-ketoacyl-ACP synthase II [Candidatus Limnocylindria bacterium]